MPITPVAEMVAAAKAEITVLPLADAFQAAEDGALLVDLRDAEELAARGRIPGALHVPRGMLEFRADPASPFHDPAFGGDRRLVLFCAAAWRSALATKALQDMGVDNVAEMEGGFEAWQTEGYPVLRD